MKRAIRKDEILSLLKNYDYLSVEYLSDVLHISQSSIRRDLAILEAQGLVKRSHGGVNSLSDNNTFKPHEFRAMVNSSEKRLICQKAAELICDGDVIFVDGSTTCLHLAEFLEGKKDITVLTNNLKFASLLGHNKDISVCCTGGTLRVNDLVSFGPIAENACRFIRTNLVFFSSRAIDDNGTITDFYEAETQLRKIAMENTDKTVFLCDSSKFSKHSTYAVCSLEEVDYFITDKSPADKALSHFKAKNIL